MAQLKDTTIDGDLIVNGNISFNGDLDVPGVNNKISYDDVVDSLESTATNLPLSANQGKKLNKSKGSVGNIDLTTCTTLQHILDWLSGNNCFYSGSTKLPAAFSPTGGVNWFRCIWECHTGELGNDGLTCIAKLNESIWYGFVTTDDSGNYILKWDKLQTSLARGVATGSLNNFVTEGTYWCDFSNITDAPWTDGYGWLEVVRYNDGMQCVQRITRYSTTHIKNVIAIRYYTNSQWYPWWHEGDETIDIADFITANSSITIDTASSIIRKTGNRMRGIIYCTGSVTTSTAGNITIGTIKSDYRPNMRSHQGAIINTHTSGQVQSPATLLVYSGGNLMVSTGLTSTKLGNDTYPWCTQLGIAFDYQL